MDDDVIKRTVREAIAGTPPLPPLAEVRTLAQHVFGSLIVSERDDRDSNIFEVWVEYGIWREEHVRALGGRWSKHQDADDPSFMIFSHPFAV